MRFITGKDDFADMWTTCHSPCSLWENVHGLCYACKVWHKQRDSGHGDFTNLANPTVLRHGQDRVNCACKPSKEHKNGSDRKSIVNNGSSSGRITSLFRQCYVDSKRKTKQGAMICYGLASGEEQRRRAKRHWRDQLNFSEKKTITSSSLKKKFE